MSFKNEILNWEDLRLFLSVARSGGLVDAVHVTGASAPTLSRRMSQLEQDIGFDLFERHQTGFCLTDNGHELLNYAVEMEGKYQSIQSWRRQRDPRPVIKITAGYWTSVFIAKHVNYLTDNRHRLRIELLSGADFLNFSRKEADLGIRNKRPDVQGLARRRIGQVKFAIFGSRDFIKKNPKAGTKDQFEACEWIMTSSEGATGNSSSWLEQRIYMSARLICKTPQSVLEAAANGAGLCILPSFIGSADNRLVRCSEPIEELTHIQWLVSHDEGRKNPNVRKTSNRLFEIFQQHQEIFG